MRITRLTLPLPLIACSWVGGAPAGSNPPASTLQKYSQLPLAFEHQQTGPGEDRYIARGEGYAIVLNGVKTNIALAPPGRTAATVSMELTGARPASSTHGPELPGKVNYILGNDSRRWRLGLPTYESVTYRNVYPGIDAVYHGSRQQLEFDLVLKPGADPARVRLKFAGAQTMSLAPSGELLLGTAAGPLRIALPSIYQGDGAARTAVRGSYKLVGHNEVAFAIGKYDHTRALVIDPTIVYSTLLGGGTGGATPQAIAADSSGNAYIAGWTSSTDFPTVNAAQGFLRGTNGFVSKMNAAGTALIYSTYLGGTSVDNLFGIAIDSLGAAWVTGQTSSTDFPVMGAYQSALGSVVNAVVAKLAPNGSLAYSTYLGATGQATGTGIAVDSTNNAYVTGTVTSPGLQTTMGAFLTTPPGGRDAFVTKFSSSGAVTYSTLLGGTGEDLASAIAVDSGGNAYVTGSTNSATFTGATVSVRTTNASGVDAFIAKLNPAGSALVYLAIVGGSASDTGLAIAVDGSGNAYIGGNTFSSDLATTVGAAQTSYGGDQDGFVAKLNTAGSVFPLITYVGGSHQDSITGIALNSAGLYITGTTQSANFPTFSPFLSQMPGNSNTAFVTTNAGASWAAFDTNIPGVVRDISPDPSHPGVIVAATDGGIFRTTNGGSSWTSQSSAAINVLSRSPANSDFIYGFAGPTPYVSTDGGLTWNSHASLGAAASQVVADPTNANTAYAISNGVQKTTDGGNTWNPSNTGLPNNGVFTQSMVAASNGDLYVFVSGAGIYKSTNRAVTWNPVNAGLPSIFVGIYHLAAAPSNPSVLYVSNGTVFTTSNAGGSWSPTAGNIPDNNAGLIAVSPSNSQVIYTTSNDAPTVFVSLDGGATWSPAGGGLGVAIPSEIVTDPTNGSRLFAVAPVNQIGFVSKLNTAGSALVYSSYLAGSGATNPTAISTDGAHNAFVTGFETGGFPTTASAFQKTGFTSDGFVVKISDSVSSCTFSVVPGTQLVYGNFQTLTYNVLAPSGCAWTASSNQAWASIVSGNSGAGSGSVFVETTQNASGSTRSATLTIAGQVLTLNQAGAFCSYSLGNNAPVVAGSGGNVLVNVFAPPGCDWAVVNNYPTAISIVSGASGSGNGTVSLNVAANNSNQSRTLIVPIGTATLTITQGYECLFSINPTLVHLGAVGGSGMVSVMSTPGCAWTATGTSFVTVTAGASGNGNGTVSYSVSAIPLGQGRIGTLTIAGLTFTVQQGTIVRDFRGISRSDALLYDPSNGQEYTALSNGNGTYQYISNLFTPQFDTLRTGDYNGDSKADLIVYNSHNALAYIGMSNGDGTFAFQSLFWSPGYDFVEPGDLNADGKTDVALYNSSTGTMYTGISNGNGTFTYKYTLISPGYTFIRLADFTGDGKADLFVYNATNGFAFLGVGDGTGGFAFSPLSISPGYTLADVGDLNGDGLADLILYNPTNGNTATGISNGTGGFNFTQLIFSPGFTSVRLADYTGDGKADVTVYNKVNAAAYFGIGTGTGTFNFQSLFWSPNYNWVEPQDVNGDGKMDIVLYNSSEGTEYTGISNGSSVFSYTYWYWGIGKVLGR